MVQAYPDRDQLLGTLDANETIGPWQVRERMAMDSGVLSIIGDVIASGGGTITLELYVDAACTKGGSTTDIMDATQLYALHQVISPDLWFKLTMTGRTTDDINIYAV